MKTISGLKLVVFLAVSTSLLSQGNIAFAQSNSCSKLTQTLRSLDRNRDYRTYKKNNATLQAATKDLKQQESKFVRGGCQAQINAKQKLSGACRIVARKILKGRSNVEKLKNSVGTGQMVAEQRQQVLQQIASRGCSNQNNNSRSSASVQRNNQPTRSLFDILFGNNGNEIQADDFETTTNLSTVRTVCARSCDGYFWPISFSTTEEYLPDDARQCKREAKGADVELFYHRNPGERAEDMISISGKPYTSTPNAFRYRNEYVQSCAIKRNVNFGSMQLVAAKEGETSRIMINFNDISFPLPLRDPRQTQEVVVAHAAITIPLPIPRPLQEGEEAPEMRLSATQKDNEPLRSFTLNGKNIRIVGPDTPYAQLGEEGV
ncbi:MAG: DUF2865 domain-containing protein [Devosiaceae bacterium]|nr:DUF2865 domain-containing protein [Devosiaceae bacterium]